MIALILAGGHATISKRLTDRLAGADIVIAADSGVSLARALEVKPDLLVGDFDSAAAEDLAAFEDVPRLNYSRHKDSLDLELACVAALERGASELLLVGAFGSRVDQSLAAVTVSFRLRREGVKVALVDGEYECQPLITGDEFERDLRPGTVFSLVALEDAVVTVTGADYPLQRAPLPLGVGLGVSNRSTGRTTALVHEGAVAVIVQWLLSGEA